MHIFNIISPEGLAVITLLAALIISENLDADETDVFGNFIIAVGSIMVTIAAHEARIKSKQTLEVQNFTFRQQLELMQKQVSLLQNSIPK